METDLALLFTHTPMMNNAAERAQEPAHNAFQSR